MSKASSVVANVTQCLVDNVFVRRLHQEDD